MRILLPPARSRPELELGNWQSSQRPEAPWHGPFFLHCLGAARVAYLHGPAGASLSPSDERVRPALRSMATRSAPMTRSANHTQSSAWVRIAAWTRRSGLGIARHSPGPFYPPGAAVGRNGRGEGRARSRKSGGLTGGERREVVTQVSVTWAVPLGRGATLGISQALSSLAAVSTNAIHAADRRGAKKQVPTQIWHRKLAVPPPGYEPTSRRPPPCGKDWKRPGAKGPPASSLRTHPSP